VLLPIHIAFLHLVIDPACSVVFEAEPEERDIMQRPPRSLDERLFGRRVIAPSLALGAALTAVLIGTFAIAHYNGLGEYASRTITFVTLVLANVALILATRLWRTSPTRGATNPALRWVSGGAITFLIAAIAIPTVRSLFRFHPMHIDDVAISAAAVAVVVALFALIRRATSSLAALASRRIAPSSSK
jgi:Ca2+-transporting ATPase